MCIHPHSTHTHLLVVQCEQAAGRQVLPPVRQQRRSHTDLAGEGVTFMIESEEAEFGGVGVGMCVQYACVHEAVTCT